MNHLKYIFRRLSVYKMNDQDIKVNQLTNTLNNLNLQDDKVVDLSYINQRINNEICNDTINKLKDLALKSEYENCDSVQKEQKKWKERFINFGIDNDIIQQLLDASILDFIPPGTKGVVRGNKFNEIVKNTIKIQEVLRREIRDSANQSQLNKIRLFHQAKNKNCKI